MTACEREGVVIGQSAIAARTVLWAAGVAASPAARWLGAAADRAGRVKVERRSQHRRAATTSSSSATRARRRTAGRSPASRPPPCRRATCRATDRGARRKAGPCRFVYTDYGTLATIGRTAAVIDFGRLRLTGFAAWLLWCVAHIFFLIGFRNRITVALDWSWAYLNFSHGSRLIIGSTHWPPAQGTPAATVQPMPPRQKVP